MIRPIARARSFVVPLVTLATLAGALLTTACGGETPPPADAATAASDDTAPYPFTVYQIRAGCPFGRTIEYRFDKPGGPATGERWTFQPIGDDSVKVTTEHFDAQGAKTGEPTIETERWAELHEHARFPHATTTITNEPLSLPAGTFDTMHYTVTSGDEVKSVWFARTLPGPPVKMEISKGGKVVFTMTMQANRTK